MNGFYDRLEEQLLQAGHRRRSQGPVRRAASGRGRMTAVLVVMVLGAGTITAWATDVLDGSSSGTGGAPAPDVAPAPRPAPAPPPPPAPGAAETPRPDVGGALSDIRVAVLNGTTTTGLARGVAERLMEDGATVPTVANFPDQQVSATRVLQLPRRADSATRVARVLGVGTTAPADRNAKVAASDSVADVIVVVGADRARGPADRRP